MTIYIKFEKAKLICSDRKQITGCLGHWSRDGIDHKGPGGNFLAKRSILYLDCGSDYAGVFDKFLHSVHLKWVYCILYKLHIKEIDIEKMY